MKKTNLIKIFAPVVAIALLIGTLVGINAFAADTPEIVSMNVEYGSELYLYYAVDKSTVDGTTPKLEVVNADGTQVLSTVTAYDEKTVNGIPCYIFKTAGIAPGQLNNVEYVRATGDNGDSDIVEYSVEEYLYTKLFKEGFAAKTEADGADYYRRNLYFGFLKYGNSAQALFYSDAADKIGDSIFVAMKGNPSVSGEHIFSDIITLEAPAIDDFDYWKVTELSPFGEILCERKLSAGFVYTVTNSAVIVPVTDDDAAEGVETYDPSIITFDGESDKITFSIGKNSLGEYPGTLNGRVYDAETGNWYYDIEKFNEGDNNSVLTFNFTPTGGDPTTATMMVAEFDIYVAEGANFKNQMQSNVITKAAQGKSSTYLYAPFLHAFTDNVVAGAWNHFKIVYEPNADFVPDPVNNPTDKESFTAKIYINKMDTPVTTITENYSKSRSDGKGMKQDIPKLDEIYGYTFSFNKASYGDFKVDNVSLIFK